MTTRHKKIFLSYSGEDAFEASLLQYAFETLMEDEKVKVWTYQRDQGKDERNISRSLKERVKGSKATIFLVSPSTLDAGATQWMELAYSDAFDVPTFVLLHRITYQELRGREKGVPPLLLSGQCNEATEWKSLVSELRNCISNDTRELRSSQ